MNPKFNEYFMDVAIRTAQLSPAVRLKVGCVAVRDRRIIACGYNGTGPGEDNVCEIKLPDGTLVTKPNVVHAEVNLIKFSKLNNINLVNCILYITHAPCVGCAEEIIRTGFLSVVYNESYKNRDGIHFLVDDNILVEKFNDRSWVGQTGDSEINL